MINRKSKELSDIARIDSGGMEWYVGRDSNGKIWITPTVNWSDGQVLLDTNNIMNYKNTTQYNE